MKDLEKNAETVSTGRTVVTGLEPARAALLADVRRRVTARGGRELDASGDWSAPTEHDWIVVSIEDVIGLSADRQAELLAALQKTGVRFTLLRARRDQDLLIDAVSTDRLRPDLLYRLTLPEIVVE